jgi:hypothetical protein
VSRPWRSGWALIVRIRVPIVPIRVPIIQTILRAAGSAAGLGRLLTQRDHGEGRDAVLREHAGAKVPRVDLLRRPRLGRAIHVRCCAVQPAHGCSERSNRPRRYFSMPTELSVASWLAQASSGRLILACRSARTGGRGRPTRALRWAGAPIHNTRKQRAAYAAIGRVRTRLADGTEQTARPTGFATCRRHLATCYSQRGAPNNIQPGNTRRGTIASLVHCR